MKNVCLVVVTLVMALGVAFVGVPQQAAADPEQITVSGDCSGATVSVKYTDAVNDIVLEAGDYQETFIMAWVEGLDGTFLDSTMFLPVKPYGNENLLKKVTLSWPELPQGTTVWVYVDHWAPGVELIDTPYDVFVYNCGPSIPFPDTQVRALITADTPVYGAPQFGSPVEDAVVHIDQEFPVVDVVANEGVDWYQIFIGGSRPWVPATTAALQ